MGYNFRLSNIQAALGLSQLKRIDEIIEQKRRVAETYTRYLRNIEGLQLPVEKEWAKNVYWMYALLVKPEYGATRDELMEWLRVNRVETRTFFCPMNQQPVLLRMEGFNPPPCPVSDRLWETGMYLPSSYTLTESDIKRICDMIGIFQLERGRHG